MEGVTRVSPLPAVSAPDFTAVLYDGASLSWTSVHSSLPELAHTVYVVCGLLIHHIGIHYV